MLQILQILNLKEDIQVVEKNFMYTEIILLLVLVRLANLETFHAKENVHLFHLLKFSALLNLILEEKLHLQFHTMV